MEKKISKEKKNQKTRKNMNLVNDNNAITLIALVITIIVLLILAGVTINLTLGENGIFKTAEQAGRNYTQAQEQELAGLANFENEINNIIGGINTPTVVEEENFADAVTATNYGDYVDYPIDLNGDGNTTNDWRIFYNNGERIFIIAADYVENTSSYLDNAGAGMTATTSTDRASTYGLYWISPPSTAQDTTQATLFGQTLWTDYAYNNEVVVSTLLNTNNWDGFLGGDYADYAIGGPTLEMWVASYNAKGYTPLYCNNIGSCGYYIGNTSVPTDYAYDLIYDENTGYNDTLYFPYQDLEMTDKTECWGYWFASPGNNGAFSLMAVHYYGSVSYTNFFEKYMGIRPVVSLKPTVTAIQNESNEVWELSI